MYEVRYLDPWNTNPNGDTQVWFVGDDGIEEYIATASDGHAAMIVQALNDKILP